MLVLIIINLMDRDRFSFTPLLIMFKTLFVPILISGFLYYMIRPLVNFLEKKGVGRGVGTLLIYLVITSLVSLLIITFGPMLIHYATDYLTNTISFIPFLQFQLGG